MNKKTVAVIFGGCSSEHEVSLRSAVTVIENINSDVYNTVLIGITKDGQWKFVSSVDDIKSGKIAQRKRSSLLMRAKKEYLSLMVHRLR